MRHSEPTHCQVCGKRGIYSGFVNVDKVAIRFCPTCDRVTCTNCLSESYECYSCVIKNDVFLKRLLKEADNSSLKNLIKEKYAKVTLFPINFRVHKLINNT